jgi:PPOX class probable F420-dependent enzyme
MPRADRISPGAVLLFREKQIGHLVTLMRDGSPQTTAVWVDAEPDGSHVLVNTAEGRLKVRNVGRDPRVSLSVVDSQNPYRFAIVRGRVVERTREGAEEHIDRLSEQYLGKTPYPLRTPDMVRVILRIKPEYVLERGTEE